MNGFLALLDKFDSFEVEKLEKIQTPNDFYKELRRGLENAKEAFISSMYFGADQETHELLKLIEKRNIRKLRTIVILDYSKSLTIDLKQKIQKYELQKNFYFMVMNNTLLPRRLSELISVYHSKIIIFDNKIILTGANIHRNYYINRLDRYYIVESIPLSKCLIKDYFLDVITMFKNSGGLRLILKASNKQNDLCNMTTNLDATPNRSLKPNTTVKTLEHSHQQKPTIITNIIVYNQTSEYFILEALVKAGFKEIYISTSYLNLPQSYVTLLQTSNVKIIVSDPKFNTFTEYGSFGYVVTSIYKFSTLVTAGRLPKSEIYEFSKKGYTIHIKGIWAFKDNFAVTVIGSSNLNRRSAGRDKELNFLIVSNDEMHIETMKAEINEILSDSSIRSLETLRSRDYSLYIILLFFILNKYL